MSLYDTVRYALAIAFIVWSFLASWIVISHLLYGRRTIAVRAAIRMLSESASTGSAAEKAARVRGVVASLPKRVLEELASDFSIAQPVAELFAAVIVERWGLTHFVRAATQHRGEFSKWRRIAALRILSLVRARQMLVLLEVAIDDPDPEMAIHAITILGSMQEMEAARLLVLALQGRQSLPSRAATELDVFPLDIKSLLAPLTTNADSNVRFWAAQLLARYPTAANAKRVLKLTHDADPKVRKAAIQSLARMHSGAAIKAARRLLADPAPFVRAHAARSLAEMRHVDAAAEIARLLADREWWARLAARESLVALGRGAWPAVEPYLRHPDRFARNGAAEVMQNLGVLDEVVARAIGDTQKTVELITVIDDAAGEGMLQALGRRLEKTAAEAFRAVRDSLGLPGEAEEL